MLNDCERVVVGDSSIGKAVFSRLYFQAGTKIARISGTIVDNAVYGSSYCIGLDDGHALEPTPPFRFLNHSCEPNCELINWEGDCPSDCEICLHSLVAIRPGDELTIDYAWTADAAIACSCGSAACRGWIVSLDELSLVQRV